MTDGFDHQHLPNTDSRLWRFVRWRHYGELAIAKRRTLFKDC